ncbi:ABC transporter permease [Aeromicrobium sp. CTD01-1L150]|uniref:ABC transporter permease n=1 Tax=Aeromicrobium sp. CTD01-1L150 TaxID=3341830 RepID=UPI0035C21368
MSATSTVSTPNAATAGGGVLRGVVPLFRLQLRTMRLASAIVFLAVAGTVTAIMLSIQDLYGDPRSLEVYQATLGSSPATAAFNGRPFDLDTTGGVAAYEVGFFGLLILPAVVMMTAIRVTRAQEDLGRTDLLTSMRVGRLAPLTSAFLLVASLIVLSCLTIATAAATTDYPTAGTLRFVLALGLFLWCAAGVGFVAAEMCQSARSAATVACAALGVTFLVRAVVDGRSWDLGWATPMGWLAEARPFNDEPPWWPYVALAVLGIALHVGAVQARNHRDLGGGVIAPRRGPATGTLRGPLALIIHLAGRSALAWWLGAFAWGAAAGLLAEEMRTVLENNPTLAEALAGDTNNAGDLMLYIASVLIGLLAAATGLHAVGRFAAEETAGRIGLIFSTRLPRSRFWLIAVVTVYAQVVLTLVIGGLAFELTAMTTDGDASLGDALSATLPYAAPAALITGAGWILLSARVRWSAAGWLLLLWATVVALLGETLQLPGWARDISPLELIGRVPVEPVDGLAVTVLLAAAMVVTTLAMPRLLKRDLASG